MFVTANSIQPAELAQLVENRGGEALLFPDHTHVPIGPPDGHPGGLRELPPEYAQMYDPLISSMAAAAATTRVRVGTAIYLVTQRDPIATAKAIATLDHLSRGRVLFGVGAGWNAVELANHGVQMGQRFRALREAIEAMTEIWTRDEASYAGATVRFAPLRSWPKPLQRPRPRILLGGNGPRAPGRALAWADGWLPHTEPGGDGPLLARLTRLRKQADAGFELTLAMAPSNPARLQAFVAAGVDRFLFQLPTGPRQLAESRIDRAMGALEALS